MTHNMIHSAAPGPVAVVNTTVLSPVEVVVCWSPVSLEETNGEIQFYRVVLHLYEGAELNRTIVAASAILEARFSGLGKMREIPYCGDYLA